MALILVVDDNGDICRPMAKLLRHLGHDGQCATSGEDALSFVQHKMPDLIILDVMMPGMDGMEVLRHLQSDHQTKSIPVIMFSAIGDPEYQAHAISKGARDYWIKASVDFDELRTRLAKLLPQAN
jgi:CheY-like chemotaxis protein